MHVISFLCNARKTKQAMDFRPMAFRIRFFIFQETPTKKFGGL